MRHTDIVTLRTVPVTTRHGRNQEGYEYICLGFKSSVVGRRGTCDVEDVSCGADSYGRWFQVNRVPSRHAIKMAHVLPQKVIMSNVSPGMQGKMR